MTILVSTHPTQGREGVPFETYLTIRTYEQHTNEIINKEIEVAHVKYAIPINQPYICSYGRTLVFAFVIT